MVPWALGFPDGSNQVLIFHLYFDEDFDEIRVELRSRLPLEFKEIGVAGFIVMAVPFNFTETIVPLAT